MVGTASCIPGAPELCELHSHHSGCSWHPSWSGAPVCIDGARYSVCWDVGTHDHRVGSQARASHLLWKPLMLPSPVMLHKGPHVLHTSNRAQWLVASSPAVSWHTALLPAVPGALMGTLPSPLLFAPQMEVQIGLKSFSPIWDPTIDSSSRGWDVSEPSFLRMWPNFPLKPGAVGIYPVLSRLLRSPLGFRHLVCSLAGPASFL